MPVHSSIDLHHPHTAEKMHNFGEQKLVVYR